MKFVVIEGLDGSGKSTQVNMLQDYLKENNISFEYVHFPRTDSPVFGDLISRFLRGELGKNDVVNPYLVALIYASDRNDASVQIRKWLIEDKLVIVDRYVFSNIAYQCAKLNDYDEKGKLQDWILNLEYDYYKIPKPDINIFFDVPFNFTVDRLTNSRIGDDRQYLNGVSDIHEADMNFQAKVREVYLHLAKTETTLKMISCSDNEKMLSPDIIFEMLKNVLKENYII